MPQTEEIFKIEPDFFCTIPGIACLQQQNSDVRLTSKTRCHSSKLMSVRRPTCEIPALLIKTSTEPSSCPIVRNACARKASSLASPTSGRQGRRLIWESSPAYARSASPERWQLIASR